MQNMRRVFRTPTRSSRASVKHPGCVKRPPDKARLFHSVFDILEDRTMLSAGSAQLDTFLAHRAGVPGGTTAMAMVDSAVPFSVPLSSFAAFAQGQPAPSQVVIVDGAVPDYDALIKGIGGTGLASSSDTLVMPRPAEASRPA